MNTNQTFSFQMISFQNVDNIVFLFLSYEWPALDVDFDIISPGNKSSSSNQMMR